MAARAGGELHVAVHRVRTDAHNFRPGLGEHLMAVAERAGFGRAARSAVLGEEVQDDDPLAKPVTQPNLLAGLRRKREIGSLIANLNAARHVCTAFLPPCLRSRLQLTVRSPQLCHFSNIYLYGSSRVRLCRATLSARLATCHGSRGLVTDFRLGNRGNPGKISRLPVISHRYRGKERPVLSPARRSYPWLGTGELSQIGQNSALTRDKTFPRGISGWRGGTTAAKLCCSSSPPRSDCGIMCVVLHFVDDDAGYRMWLRAHGNGFVLNAYRNPTPSYLKLHRAGCLTVLNWPTAGSTSTGGDYIPRISYLFQRAGGRQAQGRIGRRSARSRGNHRVAAQRQLEGRHDRPDPSAVRAC